MQTVLISGNSIAGPTLAYWLADAGFEPTLVERAPAPRPGGQAIDIRGVALRVIAAMGLLQTSRELQTGMKGYSTVDADGNELWRTDTMTLSGGSFDNDDIEILRDDLAAVLLSKVPAGTELIYGDSVTGLREDANGVSVTFEQSPPRRFDVVIGADGIHSAVRELVFGDERQFLSPLGMALAVYSSPNLLGLEDWQLSYHGDGNNCLIYTAHNNSELRLCFGFPASLEDEHRGDIDAQKKLVLEQCRSFRWQMPKLLEAIWTTPDFYLGPVAQVIMPHWASGRVALVGDAAYCPSPFSGQGTSLALVGAYVLAHELAQAGGDYRTAFARYEAKMRPFVEKNQALVLVYRQQGFGEEGSHEKVLRAIDEAKNAIVLDGLYRNDNSGEGA